MALNRNQAMSKQYQPYQMRHTASFGHPEAKENALGVNRNVFVQDFKLHYANINRTMTQRYLAVGTTLEATRTIVVHHDKRLSDSLLCQIDGETYMIQELSPNDETYNSYDLLILSRVKKGGKHGGLR